MMLRSLPGIIAAALIPLAAVAVGTLPAPASGEPKWVTYRSPTAFYSVDHPGDWRVKREENIVNFIPDNEGGGVTISAYIGKRPPPAVAEKLISGALPTQQPTSPFLKVTGSGWKGTRRTFLDKSLTPHREWEIIVATSADGMVIITSNEASPKMAERAPVYTRIMRSLRLSTPKLPS